MEKIARLDKAYSSVFSKFLRVLFLGAILFLVLINIQLFSVIRLFLFVLSVFIIIEIFFNYSLRKSLPKKSVKDGKDIDPTDTITLEATKVLLSPTLKGIINNLFLEKSIRFLLEKATISKEELQLIDLDKKDLVRKAFEIVQKIDGKYITTKDLMSSYLLLTEEKTKLLFSKKLKEIDLLNITTWTRFDFPTEEELKKTRVRLVGEGIGQDFVSGWTLETKKYTQNFTDYALKKRSFTVGREREFAELVSAVSKKHTNNALLVGDVGVGKENLVEALAYDSFEGILDKELNHKKIYLFMVGSFMAGVTSKGELEGRLEAVIQEISHANDIILYIPEFQNILGASSFDLDISGALLPHLRSGKIPIIATISSSNYKVYLEDNPMHEVFEVIKVIPPEREIAIKMLLEKAREIEQENMVHISFGAIVSAISYATHYLPDDVLPGNAVTLLSDTAHTMHEKKRAFGKVIILSDDIVSRVEEKARIKVGPPTPKEKELLLALEETLHKKIVGQEEAISAISEALRRLRAGIASTSKPISFLFLGPTGVGKTETAKTLADIYYGGWGRHVRTDMSEYSDTNGINRLLGAPPGEGTKRGELTEKVHDNPFSLVLLDEFEKAHPDILNLFLQVLEDGRLTDNRGRTVSFVNCLIIATSNAGSELIREEIQKTKEISSKFQQDLLDFLQTKGIFKPELLNRFDAVIAFKPLDDEKLLSVTRLMLEATARKLEEQDIDVTFHDDLVAKVAHEGSNEQFGARPLRRFIQDKVEDMVAQKILKGEIARGAHITLSVDESGNIISTAS